MAIIKDAAGTEKKQIHKFVNFKDKRVLEIGCGEGRLTWKYASATHLILGVDSDRNALRVALVDSPTAIKSKLILINSSAEQLPFKSNSFDLAIFAWSF